MDSKNKEYREKKITIRIITSIIAAAVFTLILYHVYGFIVWKSNVWWIALAAFSCVIEPVDHWWSFFISHKRFLIMIDLLLAFCIAGNYLFCYPIAKNVGMINILEYLLLAIFCTPIVVCVSSFSKKKKIGNLIVQNTRCDDRQLKTHMLFYMSVPIVIGIVSMIALNPCVVSYDAYEVIAEANGLTPVQEYVGVPYVLWFRLWLSFINSVSFLCFIQIVIYAATVGYFLFYIEKQYNIKFEFLFLIFSVFSILPNNIMMLVTLSKDVYYTIFLCLMMISMMLIRKEERVRNYIFWGISVFLVWSIRQSGSLAALFVVIFGVFYLKKKRVFVMAATVSVVVSFLFNAGLVKITDAESIPGGMKYVALYQDILGVYYAGGSVSGETDALVEKGVGDNPEFKDEYTPYWAYYDNYYPELENVKVTHFIKCYMDTFIHNPILMCRSILCRIDMMWDIRPGKDAFESWQWKIVNSGGDWTNLVAERHENLLTKILNLIGERSKASPYKNVIWRVAIWNVLFLNLLGCVRDKHDYLVFLPFFGFAFAYAVSLGWSHYRYYWADELMMFLSCIYIIADVVAGKEKGKY